MRDQSSVVPGFWLLFLPRAGALLAVLVMAGGAAACGQKGPLSLPTTATAATPAAGAASSAGR